MARDLSKKRQTSKDWSKRNYADNSEAVKADMRAYRKREAPAIRKRDKLRYSERKQEMRDSTLRRRYGITLEEYTQMAAKQRGLCAICEQPETYKKPHSNEPRDLSVDHNHTTTLVRELLCWSCNIAIGKMGDDSARLRRAADYLDRHTQKE